VIQGGTSQKMIVATFNANSIRSRIPLILDWLNKHSPDVLCIQETKVQDADFPAEPLREAGYYVAFRGQKAHAGVATICRQEPEEVAFGLDDGGEPDEPRLIRAVVQGIPIVNTYVPQGRSVDSEHFQYKLEWFNRLRVLFERHLDPGKPAIWLGDFNVAPEPMDVHDPKRLESHVDFHPEARAALQSVKEWGWVDLFRQHHPDAVEYSYYDYRVPNAIERGLGWRVDHIWATEPLAKRCKDCWIDLKPRQAEKPSDHTIVVAEFDL